MFSARHFVFLLLVILALSIESVNGGPKKEKDKNPKFFNCNPNEFQGIVQQHTGNAFTSSNFAAPQSNPSTGSYFQDLLSQVEASAAGNAFNSSSNFAAPQQPTGHSSGFFNSLPNSTFISFNSNNSQPSQLSGNQQDEVLDVEPLSTVYPPGSKRFPQGRSSKGSKRKGGKQ
ncbi:hypothetical protein niasHS_015670 [Heterodera schachtii]|uniref:Uncharacterized protein n=1 Tax=Heterodera schachtii TaxID=97005 RepID=A0ABD2HW13_HETSC